MTLQPVNTTVTNQRPHKSHIDFLRIAAIYMVLFNHTGTNGYVLYTITQESVLYPFYLFNAIFIKIAVPLFFMITGALLLVREESIEKIVKERFLKYLIVLIVSSAAAYLYFGFRDSNASPRNLTDFIAILYSSQHSVALWYLYAYLPYLLMLPFLRKLAKNMSEKEFSWMILMYGLFKLVSIFQFLVWKESVYLNGNFSFFISFDYVFYPLMGYFIEHKMSRAQFNQKNLIRLIIASFLSIVVCCLLSHYRSKLLDAWSEANCQTFFNTLIFIPTITAYFAAKMLFMHHDFGNRVRQILGALGNTTFGLYLIEYLCRNETLPIFWFLRPLIHTLPACWVWIAASCIMGMGITWFLKKIPLVNRFI